MWKRETVLEKKGFFVKRNEKKREGKNDVAEKTQRNVFPKIKKEEIFLIWGKKEI